MKINLPKDLCLRLADLEDDSIVTAGSPKELNLITESPSKTEECPSRHSSEFSIVRGVAFGRFIEMKRRDMGLTPEQLAEVADLEISEILSMERDSHYDPEPTAVTQLAKVFHVSPTGFSQLAGLTVPKNEKFVYEMTKFAARSESSAKLTPEERSILEHYASILGED